MLFSEPTEEGVAMVQLYHIVEIEYFSTEAQAILSLPFAYSSVSMTEGAEERFTSKVYHQHAKISMIP